MDFDLKEGDFDEGDEAGKPIERGTNPDDDMLLDLAMALFATIAEAEHVKALLAMFPCPISLL